MHNIPIMTIIECIQLLEAHSRTSSGLTFRCKPAANEKDNINKMSSLSLHFASSEVYLVRFIISSFLSLFRIQFIFISTFSLHLELRRLHHCLIGVVIHAPSSPLLFLVPWGFVTFAWSPPFTLPHRYLLTL